NWSFSHVFRERTRISALSAAAGLTFSSRVTCLLRPCIYGLLGIWSLVPLLCCKDRSPVSMGDEPFASPAPVGVPDRRIERRVLRRDFGSRIAGLLYFLIYVLSAVHDNGVL